MLTVCCSAAVLRTAMKEKKKLEKNMCGVKVWEKEKLFEIKNKCHESVAIKKKCEETWKNY